LHENNVMKINSLNKITLDQVLTMGEFVKLVRKKTSNDKISNQTIHYHLNHTDNLDFVDWCGMKLIVNNDKAKNFNPGNYYKG